VGSIISPKRTCCHSLDRKRAGRPDHRRNLIRLSVGNIPLASLLWAHGISFGGVISFIYADLLVIPILMIYAKYYGARAAAWITGIFYVAMVLAGIIVDLTFAALGLIPKGSRPPSAIEHAHIIWNYTSGLDLIALLFAA
jgi:uncharacterized membrane protein YraQ (UPF0718 family)